MRSLKRPAFRGVAYLTLSTFYFGIAGALVKLLIEDYSVFEIAFARNLFGLIPAIIMSSRKWRAGFVTANPLSHLWRCIFGVASMLLIFASYRWLSLPAATAITFAAPLFITALSVLLLQEHVGSHRWSAVIAGFAGILILLKPGGNLFNWGGFAALAAAFFHALAMISLSRLRITENTEVTTLYFTLFATVITGCLLPLGWKIPDAYGALLLVLLGLISGAGQFLLTKAYGLADASLISPFSYISMVWAVLFGFFIWNDVPETTTILGSIVVVLSGIYILHRERTLAIRRADRTDPVPKP